MCDDTGECIPAYWLCDGISDCFYNDDEEFCEGCSDDEYMCDYTEDCIPVDWLCDGDSDCLFGDDEEFCEGTIVP